MNTPADPSPSKIPGIQDDRGRIILILVVTAIAGLGIWIYNSWAGWEEDFGEIWDEIVTDITAEIENEFDIDLSDETETVETESLPPGPSYMPVETETDPSNEDARQMLRDSRQQIIQQLREQGQEDQIPQVLEVLDEMEQAYY